MPSSYHKWWLTGKCRGIGQAHMSTKCTVWCSKIFHVSPIVTVLKGSTGLNKPTSSTLFLHTLRWFEFLDEKQCHYKDIRLLKWLQVVITDLSLKCFTFTKQPLTIIHTGYILIKTLKKYHPAEYFWVAITQVQYVNTWVPWAKVLIWLVANANGWFVWLIYKMLYITLLVVLHR